MAMKTTEDRMLERKIGEAKEFAGEKIGDARNYAIEQKDKFDVLVGDHPLLFVGGAFIGGMLLGKMISDRR